MKATLGLHYERQLARVIGYMREVRGDEGVARRRAEIDALPAVEWRGKTLRTVTCCGDFGRGPHTVNLPETTLWALMDVRHYRCPFHG